MKTTPNNAWVLEPVTYAVGFVAEEARTGALLQQSLIFIENGEPLLKIAAQRLKGVRNRRAVSGIKTLLRDAPTRATWAGKLRENDYALLNAHSLVAIWGALEACVEDTIIAILKRSPQSLQVLGDIGVKAPEVAVNELDDEDLSKLYQKLENVVRVKGDVVATQEKVLGAFGLSAACPTQNAILLKANALRNVIVHGAGVIDKKATEQSPDLEEQLGQRCVITRDLYLQFYNAVRAALVALMGSITSSQYMARNDC